MSNFNYEDYKFYEVFYGSKTGRPILDKNNPNKDTLRAVFYEGSLHYLRILDFKNDGQFSINIYKTNMFYVKNPKLVGKLSVIEKAVIKFLKEKKNSGVLEELSLPITIHNYS